MRTHRLIRFSFAIAAVLGALLLAPRRDKLEPDLLHAEPRASKEHNYERTTMKTKESKTLNRFANERWSRREFISTNSQGDPFGSGVTPPGTGILLNNELTDWMRGDANAFLDQPLAGARPMTSGTPAIILREGLPVLVVGGAGGPRIPIGVLQTIVNFVDFGLDIARAVDAERIDAVAVAAGKKELLLEVPENDPNPRIAAAVQADLVRREHVLRRKAGADEYDSLPWIEAAGVVDPATGEKCAVMDPRHSRGGSNGDDEERGAAGQGS